MNHRNFKAFVLLMAALMLWAWLAVAATGCTSDQLNGTGDAFLRAGTAATQPVSVSIPTTQGEPPAVVSFSAGAFGAAGGAALIAVGALLKLLAGAVQKREGGK